MSNNELLTLGGLVFIALAHIVASKAKLISALETHGWTSFSAGASLSYVFLHVFPEIGLFQQQVVGHTGHHQPVSFVNQPLYLAAIGGFCFLYLLGTIETRFYDEKLNELHRHKYYMPIFLVRIVFYFLYNIMISYIITQRPGEGLINITLIALALMLHFFLVNISFLELYKDLFDRFVRWLAIAGLLLGWILGITVDLPDLVIVTVFSLIGGMITYVAMQSELPRTENKAPFHFLVGVAIYALIVLAIPFFGLSNIASH